MTKNTILITGGAGYIGSHVNQIIQNAGYNTVVLDNLSRGHRQTVLNSVFIQGDIGDRNILDEIFNKFSIQAVMHFAALIDVGESVRNPKIYYENNFSRTLNLLSSMAQHHIEYFVFSSSAAIFGLPQKPLIDEVHPCNPINPYGLSKLMIETALNDFEKAYGIKSCCLRYFNAAGGDPHYKIKYYQSNPTNLIPIALKCVQNKKVLTIFGNDYPTKDGTCIRDYIHIDDLAHAHLLGLEHLKKTNRSCRYNLGNGYGYSIHDVIKAIQEVTKETVEFQICSRRPGDPPILISDSKLASQELLWTPHYSDLESMVDHAWHAMTPENSHV